MGQVILNELVDEDVRSVVDLGVGEGSLVRPVISERTVQTLVTVDLDPSVAGIVQELGGNVSRHEHWTHDALDPALPDRLTERGFGGFDAAICNPPFFRPAWENRYADMLRAASFEDAFKSVSEVTAEGLFLAQNLRLVRNGGVILLIVPDSFATGRRARAIRRALMEQHTLVRAIQLPAHAFHDTDALCFLLVIRKGVPTTADVDLRSLDSNGSLSEPLLVSSQAAIERLDHSFYQSRAFPDEGRLTLRMLGAEVRRGSLSSVDVRAADFAVLHTPDLSNTVAVLDLPNGDVPSDRKLVVAQRGDILIARIDRRLHEKMAVVRSGQAALSDCIYRIRVDDRHRDTVFSALSSDEGRESIKALTKGVGARLLGKGDLLDLPLVADRL